MNSCCRSCISSISSFCYPWNPCCRRCPCRCCCSCCCRPQTHQVVKKRSRFSDLFSAITTIVEDSKGKRKKIITKNAKSKKTKKRVGDGDSEDEGDGSEGGKGERGKDKKGKKGSGGKDKGGGDKRKKGKGGKSDGSSKGKKAKGKGAKGKGAKGKGAKGKKVKGKEAKGKGKKGKEAKDKKGKEKGEGESGDASKNDGNSGDNSDKEKPVGEKGDASNVDPSYRRGSAGYDESKGDGVPAGNGGSGGGKCRPDQLVKCPYTCTMRPKRCMPNQIGPCHEACLKGVPYTEPSMFPGSGGYQSNGGVFGPGGAQGGYPQNWGNTPYSAPPQTSLGFYNGRNVPRTAPPLYGTPQASYFPGGQGFMNGPQSAPPFYNPNNRGTFDANASYVYGFGTPGMFRQPFSPNGGGLQSSTVSPKAFSNYLQGDGTTTEFNLPSYPVISSYKCSTCGRETKFFSQPRYVPPTRSQPFA